MQRSATSGSGKMSFGGRSGSNRDVNRDEAWGNPPKRKDKKKGTQFGAQAVKGVDGEQKVLQRPTGALRPMNSAKTGDSSFYAETQRNKLMELFEAAEDHERDDSELEEELDTQSVAPSNVDTSSVHPRPLQDIRQQPSRTSVARSASQAASNTTGSSAGLRGLMDRETMRKMIAEERARKARLKAYKQSGSLKSSSQYSQSSRCNIAVSPPSTFFSSNLVIKSQSVVSFT